MTNPKKVYCVIWEDRHIDADVILFSDFKDALTYAEEIVKDNANAPEYIDVWRKVDANAQYSGTTGVLYGANYSPEGDSVMIVRRVIDGRLRGMSRGG